MRIEPATVTAFTIYDAKALDPILVILQDFGAGCGRLVLECYGEAWSAYWGAMGQDTLQQFITDCSVDYIANRLWPPHQRRNKEREAYLERIVTAVQEVLRTARAPA